MSTDLQDDNTKSEQLLLDLLDAAILAADADFGNIQIVDKKTGDLKIVAQRGFPQYWLEYWTKHATAQGACGSAARARCPIIVNDVDNSPFFSPEGVIMQRRAGVRACHSTPLVTPDGTLIGILSVHYKMPREFAAMDFKFMDSLMARARHALAFGG